MPAPIRRETVSLEGLGACALAGIWSMEERITRLDAHVREQRSKLGEQEQALREALRASAEASAALRRALELDLDLDLKALPEARLRLVGASVEVEWLGGPDYLGPRPPEAEEEEEEEDAELGAECEPEQLAAAAAED